MMTSKEIKRLLKENKQKETKAMDQMDDDLLTEVFKEYDYLFNELLKAQQKEVLGC